MATCPNCGRYLNENHRCRGGLRRFARAATIAGIGAVGGWAASPLLMPNPHPALVVMMAILGGTLVTAVVNALKP
jgi:hypothetical protein